MFLIVSGFLKEQVRITFVQSPAPGVVRVHGQRPLGNNKWSRFNQTFPLPQNCDSSKIHGKFHNGILTVTLPKEVTTQIGPKEAPKPIQEPPTALPKTAAAAAAAAAAAVAKPQKVLDQDEKVPSKEKNQISAPPATGPSQKPAVEANVQKGQDAIHQTAMIQQRDEKRVIPLSSPSPQNAASETKSQKGKDEVPPKTMADYQREIQNKYISEATGKPGEPKDAEKVVKTPLHNGKAITDERSSEKQLGSGVEEEKRKEDSIAAKQGMKNLGNWMNNEETQLFINLGAAVLVLLAFGAYSTYSFWFSGKPKN